MKKVLCMLLVFVMLFSMLLISANAADSDIAKTASQADSIVSVAINEAKSYDNLGSYNGGEYYGAYLGSSNKYNGYNGQAWCAYFVYWCAQQAGISNDIIPPSYACNRIREWYQNRGLYQSSSAYGGNYTPKAGDLVIFDWNYNTSDGDHIGIVTGVDNGYISTVEGNTNTAGWLMYRSRRLSLNHGWIIGYCTPAYERIDTPVDLGSDFYAMIANNSEGKAIGLDLNNNVVVCPYEGYSDQLWYFIQQNDGGYKIVNVFTDAYLIGDNIASLEYEAGSNNKIWYIMACGSKYCLTHYSGDNLKWLHPAWESWTDGTQITLNDAESMVNINLVTGTDNKPKDFKITTDIMKINEGGNLQINWTKSKFANYYNLDVWKDDGEHLISTKTRNNYYLLQDLQQGYYGVYINAENQIGSSNYTVLHFTVEKDNNATLGDADGDGEVTSVDATYVQRYCAKIGMNIDEAVLMNGDVDGNGLLEIVDATYIQRHLAKIITPYPIGEPM